VDEAHESGDGFLATQSDVSEAFEFIEEAFDLMALPIEVPVGWRRDGPVGVGLYLRCCPKGVDDESASRIGIIGASVMT